jgi:hypothetical protein
MQMCGFMKHRLNYTIPHCQTNLEKTWSNETSRLCQNLPQGEIVEASRFPFPTTHETRICKILKSEQLEDCGTTGMCVMLKQYFNTTVECQAAFGKVWDDEAGKYCQKLSQHDVIVV